VYEAPVEEICENKPDLQPGPGWIVEVPIKLGEDDWFIPCKSGLPFKDFLANTKVTDILLNVEAKGTWRLDDIVAAASKYDSSKRFAVTTRAQKVAVYLRKKAPAWLFAADPSVMTRLRAYESFFIESVMDFWPDFAIVDFSPHEDLRVDARMAAELARRKKRILWKWDGNASETPPIAIQGVLTNRPSAARQKWPGRL
jgi:hypothetical protein